MSERLVFELQAVDRATAPLKAVQDQLDRTTAATRRLGGQTATATKDFRKFAMGALQQAGFQIGDFAVQVANGTNKMQAFGQQAPQILQIFGPIGAVVGAAVAVFAAFSVAVDKSTSSTKMAADATETLKNRLLDLNAAAAMARFGVVDPEEASILERIDELTSKIAEAQIRLGEIKLSNSLEDRGRMQSALAELNALQQQKDALAGLLDNYKKVTAINGQMLALQEGHYAALIEKLVPSEKDRIAVAEKIHAQMIAIQGAQAEYIKGQESFNQRLIQGYALYGNLRRQAQGLAADAAAAAQAAVDPQMFKTIGAYQAYARSRLAAPTEPTKPKEDKPSGGGGGGATDPMKTLREQLALETELLGKTEAQQRVIQALGLDYKKYGDTALNSLVGQITEMDRLNKLAEQQKEIASTIRSAFSGAFMSMVDGTKSVKDAFRDMARSIIMKLYEVLVVQRIVNGIMGFVGKAFPALAPALATAWNGGGVTGNKPVLVGEKGPEIIVPSRNSQIVANHQMGGGGVSVVQNISFGAGVTRAEIQAMLPKIVESTKAAVFDAQRRSVNGMGY